MKKIIASAGFVLALSMFSNVVFASMYPDQPVPPDKISTFNEDLILYDTNPASLNEGGGEMMYLEDRNCIPEVDAGSGLVTSTGDNSYFEIENFFNGSGSWFLPVNGEFLIYPNPATGPTIHIDFQEGSVPDWWDVIAVNPGQPTYVVMTVNENIYSGMSVNISSWPEGQYMFRLFYAGDVSPYDTANFRKRPPRN